MIPAQTAQSGVQSPSTGSSISGRVTDDSGNGVVGVTMRACNLSKQPVLLVPGWGGPDKLTDDTMGFAELFPWMAADGYSEGCNLFYATGVTSTNSPDQNHLEVRRNLRAAYDKIIGLSPAMDLYNLTHFQPDQTCYYLIGGDFLQQSGVSIMIWKVLYKPFKDHPGDIGVSLRSSRQPGIHSQLKSNYPLMTIYPSAHLTGF